MSFTIRQAKRTESEHKALCKIANTSKFTNSFSSHMFSAEAAYDKGWIRLAQEDDVVVGLTCVRHKVRSPKTVLYFITVGPDARSSGVGEALMDDLEVQTPHKCIELNVAHNNPRAKSFYERLGYLVLSNEAINGTAWHLEKQL